MAVSVLSASETLTRNGSVGPYDHLYAATDLLWPSTPGRMVVEAASRLSPGLALDLGCGDGKNFSYLERVGWLVDGVDISSRAIAAAHARLEQEALAPRGRLICDDVVGLEWSPASYNLVVAYGLLHCLSAGEAASVLEQASAALVPGGLLAVATFNNQLPVPDVHGTGQLYLRDQGYVPSVIDASLEPLLVTQGLISERHDPVIGEHQHALTWALLRKRDDR